ncbi:MAG TPA: CAP domain-containing protein [Planctomycetaceae bacterium]|nr:CAP domain-containing protein [Planctomycetaceae bacterium]
MRSICVLCWGWCLIGCVGMLQAQGYSPEVKTPDIEAVERLVFQKVNAFRNKQGRHALEFNRQLDQTARDFAQFMARNDKYGHEADGREPWDRAAAHGYAYCVVAENIAYDYSSIGFATVELADSLVEGWENSPPHRRNMLDPDVDDSGVGVAYSRKSAKYYAVQLFGRPKSKEIRFEVRNESPVPVSYRIDQKTFDVPPETAMTHQVCRPPKLVFLPPPKGVTLAFEKNERPQNGDELVIRQLRDGTLVLQNHADHAFH